VEFLFDVGSPASYLAFRRLPAIAARTGAHIEYTPILLGGVFKETGNRSPAEVPAKGRYVRMDLDRFARRHGIPFQSNPHFPINTLALMRGAAGLKGSARFMPYLEAIFTALWERVRNLSDPAEVAAALSAADMTQEEFQALITDSDVKAKLLHSTEAALQRGVFGAPSFFVGDQIFFGQDRLDWVEEALAGWTRAVFAQVASYPAAEK
jgi:2-hydroxychromene-2-carboxylate isomerase